MKRPRSIASGFTLVEILVVLAIVVLLAALLLPVFARVRDRARTATCAANLKQIGVATALYAQDNNQRLPPIAQLNGLTWVDAVYPYAKAPGVFECPSAEHGKYVPGGSPGAPIIMGAATTQFGDNGSYDIVTPFVESQTTQVEGGTHSVMTIQAKGLPLSKYRLPSSTILMLDGGDTTLYFHNNYAAINPGIDPIHSIDDLKDGGVLPLHRSGVNLLYVDGHVKWQDLQSLTSTPIWRFDGREPPAPTTNTLK